MRTHTVGWVRDKDTARRRLLVYLLPDASGLVVTLAMTLETGERGGHLVALDIAGATALYELVGTALDRLAHPSAEGGAGEES